MPSPKHRHLRCPDAPSLAEALARLCDKPQAGTDGWMVCCPSHDDAIPSLHITPKDDKVLLHCFAGCGNAAIMAALGLSEGDLFVHHDDPRPERLVAVYDYVDPDGVVLHQKLRYAPKKFVQRRPDPAQPGHYIYRTHDMDRVLYHLPALIEAIAQAERVYLVEGEKSADALTALGVVATCSPDGAGKWSEAYSALLQDAHVAILPDYDVQGAKHATLVATALMGMAASIKVVADFHTATSKSDVADWLAAGGTREELEAIVDTAPLYPGPATEAPLGWASPGVPSTTLLAGRGAAWRKDLFQKKNGELTQNYFNVTQILHYHEHWQQPAQALWFDVVKQMHMCGTDVITKNLLVQCAAWFGREERLPITNLDLLRDCLYGQCEAFPRDPLQHWINSLPAWDQTPRLTTWLARVAGAEDDAYSQDISRVLLVGMLARALHPGCLCRYVVIFVGAENTGKSSLVRALATPEWYYAMKSDFESKEAHMEIQGAWVAELPELDALNRTGETRLKAFITLLDDSWIPKYANDRLTVPRRTVFVGTTNEDTFLKGQTGNTRFVPLKTGDINLDAFQAMRTQLFAEAKVYYDNHLDDWWLFSPEGQARLETERDARRKINVYEDLLQTWLRTPIAGSHPPRCRTMTTWEEIASEALRMQTPEHWKDKNVQTDVANAMRALKWEHHKRRVHKGDPPRWVWDAPDDWDVRDDWGVPF
jgi:5S rRNA maturation endonuclease (ribonuclease M5)